MTTAGMAAALLGHAAVVIEEAERMAACGAHALAVRRAQEALELALKGLLRACAVEIPHVHDVGPTLRRFRDRLPLTVQPEVDRLARLSRRLAGERTVAFYGAEESGATPDELYDAVDAREAVAEARAAVQLCRTALPPASA